MSTEVKASGFNWILFAAVMFLSGLGVVLLVALEGPGRLITLGLTVLGMLACIWGLARSSGERSTSRAQVK